MIKIIRTPRYVSSRDKFLKNNSSLTNKAIKAIILLKENPKHPGLNMEKLKGSQAWTIRIDHGNRIFFHWIDKETILLIDIGKHDKYRKY